MARGGLSPEKRPYTHTRVQILHISNDPGIVCLPIPQDWAKTAGARARHLIELTGSGPSCAQDLATLEASLSANPFSQLTAPIDAILSVRGEHSKQAVSRLSEAASRTRHAHLRELSMAAALQKAYGSPRSSDALAELPQTNLLTLTLAPALRQAVETAVDDGRLDGAVAREFSRQLDAWETDVLAERTNAECYERFSPLLGPPLGWTLSKNNQAFMRCMAFRVAHFNGDGSPPLPASPVLHR